MPRPRGTCRLERIGVEQRIGETLPPGRRGRSRSVRRPRTWPTRAPPRGSSVAGGSGARPRSVGRGCPWPPSPTRAPATTAWIDACRSSPLSKMQRRAPADLGVARAVGRDVLDQLVGDARDRRPRPASARWAGRRPPGAAPGRLPGEGPKTRGHRGQVHAFVEAAFAGQLERRRRPQRPIEVEMQLRLGHPREESGRRSSPTVTRSYGSGPHRSEPRLGSR